MSLHFASRRSSRSRLGVLLCGSVDRARDEAPLAIKGYDPVAYFTLQRATPGVAQFEYDWDEHRWQFANAQHRDLFKADPVRYAPQFANFCAVALARGEVREANPEYWLISRRQALSVRQGHRARSCFARTSSRSSSARTSTARYCRRSSEPDWARRNSPALRNPSRRSARSFGLRNLLPKVCGIEHGVGAPDVFRHARRVRRTIRLRIGRGQDHLVELRIRILALVELRLFDALGVARLR